ncbi:MAG: hypothetical protein K2N34_04640, partial [Lachnospiraceae bacterium]|nr:hypothetical protein [Lachnospiraceae bacterium]
MNESGNSSVSKNLKYILVLVGVLALVLSYFLVFRKYTDKSKDIQTELDSLQAKCDDLEAKNGNKANIEKLTEEAEQKCEELLKKFDGDVTPQSVIMDNYNMGERLQIKIPTLSLATKEQTYTFGQLTSSNPNGGTGGMNAEYTGMAMSYNITTLGTYDQMKQTLNYIMNEEGKRKVPISVTFSYSSTEQQVALNIAVKEYSVTGGDRVQKAVEI